MGIHISTAVSLMTDIPLVVVRKRAYGLDRLGLSTGRAARTTRTLTRALGRTRAASAPPSPEPPEPPVEPVRPAVPVTPSDFSTLRLSAACFRAIDMRARVYRDPTSWRRYPAFTHRDPRCGRSRGYSYAGA
jgi:hypothetical protein